MKRFNKISKVELKKYNGKKCRFETNYWNICEWEIYVEENKVFVLHNNNDDDADWCSPKEMKGYNYSWVIYTTNEVDETSDNFSYNRIEIDIEEEIEEFAKTLHNKYEELSKLLNWDTQEKCKVEFNDLPENNKKVMLWLSKFILENYIKD